MGETTSRITFWRRLGGWAAELVLVFIGVYAAFWLNNFQQHQHDAERRDQILASIERTLSEGIESGKNNRVKEEEEAAKFQRALGAGEMPPLHPFVFTTDYSPGDFATLLQSGGTELLDLETRTALRNDESVIRWGLSRLQRYQKLSDELIVPNLDQGISFFTIPRQKNCGNVLKYIPKPCKQRWNSLAIWNELTPICSSKSKPNGNTARNGIRALQPRAKSKQSQLLMRFRFGSW
jgi:hypothetical protein